MPLTPLAPLSPPVRIDTVDDIVQTQVPGQPVQVLFFNNLVYMVVTYINLSTSTFGIKIASSPNGIVWTLLDPTNGPTNNGAGYLDAANSRFVFFQVTGSNSIQIQVFNLLTNKWGVPFAGTGAPTDVSTIQSVYLRPDLSRILFYTPNAGVDILAQPISAGNVYAMNFSVTTNATIAGGSGLTSWQSTMDITGRVHGFFSVTATPVDDTDYYQAVETTNTLGQFYVFPAPASAGGYFLGPSVSPLYIFVPGRFNDGWVGTPINNPIWTYIPDVFPAATTQNFVQAFGVGQSVFDPSTGFWIIAPMSDTGNANPLVNLQLSRTSFDPDGPWHDVTYANVLGTSLAGSLLSPGITIINGLPFINSNGNDGAANIQAWSFSQYSSTASSGGAGGAGGAIGAGVSGVGAAVGSGMMANAGGRFKCCSNGHQFQAARMAEVLRQEAIRKQEWPYIHEFPPSGSITVGPISSIPSPVVGAPTAILTYIVPQGFRFIMLSIVQDFQGAAFQPGSALWTVDRDFQPPNLQGSFVQGLIQIPIPLGSFSIGREWPLPRAYEFEPLEIIRSTVTNVSLGVGLPNAFISGFFGYLVPAITGRNIVLQRS